MNDPVLCQNITKRIGDLAIVDDVSLSLEPGSITALLGASGAGKSTLLRIIAGLETLDSGAIKIGEKTLSSESIYVPAEKRRIGLIFQDFALFPHMSALKNIMFGLAHLSKDEAKNVAIDWLSRVGLSERGDSFPNQLSGGEQQRIAIARALAPQPVALLLDEAFSGLDPSLRESVRRTAIDAIRDAGIPALLVTHDPAEAMQVADRIAVMRGGRILQTGFVDDIYRSPASLHVAKALGPINVFRGEDLPKSALNAQFAASDKVVCRPESIMLSADSGVEFTASHVQLMGPLKSLEFRFKNSVITAYISPNSPINTDEKAKFRIDPNGVFIFPSDAA